MAIVRMWKNVLLWNLIWYTMNVVPPFDPTLIQKILTRYSALQEVKKEIYDILVQSLDSKVDDPASYYVRAYKVDPIFMTELFNCFNNTDIDDLNTIFLTLQEKYEEYDAKVAYLSIDWQKSYKKIGNWESLHLRLKEYLPEWVRKGVESQIKKLWIRNLFEVYINIQPDWLYFNLAVNVENDADTMDEENSKTKNYYYWPLYFQNTQEKVIFVRKRSGEDWDFFDNVVYE